MDPRSQGKLQIDREAADPSMIQFKGKYYIFASMNLSVWVSEDMANWKSYSLPENLPLYDYAPDVRVCGDYVYFSASKKGEICNFYRTKDIIRGPYEEIAGTFDFWDPNLFFDNDGKKYFMIEDKTNATTDLPHDFIVRENGILIRYVRLTIIEVPYGVDPCISGIRVFGIGTEEKPGETVFAVKRSEDKLDLLVTIEGTKDATGYNILWGHKEDKLYHSYQIYRSVSDVKNQRDEKIEKRIGALVKDQNYFVRVDAYNENGITKGKVMRL